MMTKHGMLYINHLTKSDYLSKISFSGSSFDVMTKHGMSYINHLTKTIILSGFHAQGSFLM
jgi:hypothetical protein